MTITFTFASWMIPALITICGLIWALFIYDDGGGWLGGLGNLFMLIPTLVVSCISWMVWGFLK
jgi:hypothetical protein